MARELPTLKRLKLGRDAIDLDYYLTSNYDNISDASAELPAVIEWVNEQNQGYVERMHILKGELKEAEASAFLRLAEPGTDESFENKFPGVKRTSEALNHAMELDPEVRQKRSDLAHHISWVERLRQLQVSLTAKLDMVRSSEATRRRVFLDPHDDPSV
jgi:hypothetical protein